MLYKYNCEIWKNPYLFDDTLLGSDYQKNVRTIELLIKESIENTIRKLLPVKEILRQHLDTYENNNNELKKKNNSNELRELLLNELKNLSILPKNQNEEDNSTSDEEENETKSENKNSIEEDSKDNSEEEKPKDNLEETSKSNLEETSKSDLEEDLKDNLEEDLKDNLEEEKVEPIKFTKIEDDDADGYESG